jgi:hypothetical protein
MKNSLIALLSVFFLVSCAGSGSLEKRISELETANNQKNQQIDALTQLAYSSFSLASGIDSTETLVLPKEFEGYSLSNSAVCKAKCLTKLRQRLNICRHVAPQNRQNCENTAFFNYTNCIGGCH